MAKEVSLKHKKALGEKIYIAIVMTILVVYTVSIFMILYFGLLNSFKSEYDLRLNFIGFPKNPHSMFDFENEAYSHALAFGNYIDVFNEFYYQKTISYFSIWSSTTPMAQQSNVGFIGMLSNTLFLAGVCSLAQVLVCYLMGYLAAKYKFKFSGVIYGMCIVMMSVPTVGSTPAMITLLQDLGIFGTHLGMLLMRTCYGGMYFLVFYAFFEGLPDSYMEAAEIDGASQMSILTRIIIPMGIKMISTVTLLLFVANWNDYNFSFVYMPTVPTLAFGVYNLVFENATHPLFKSTIPNQMAGCFLLIVPTTIMFVIFKDKLMGNISAGGLKG